MPKGLKHHSVYLLLFAVQLFGALFFVKSSLPAFRQLVVHPGEQLDGDPFDVAVISTLLAMQCAYWYRLLRVPLFCFTLELERLGHAFDEV
jgi:hypothetical protein